MTLRELAEAIASWVATVLVVGALGLAARIVAGL